MAEGLKRAAKAAKATWDAPWNPKRLGVVKSKNGPHETDVWLYLINGTLDIVVQVNQNGMILGQTIHSIRLPRRKR